MRYITQLKKQNNDLLDKAKFWTRDRKANLFFWLLLSLGWASAMRLWEWGHNIYGNMLLVSTLILVPTLTTLISRTKHQYGNKFSNSKGQLITKAQMPTGSPLIFLLISLFSCGFIFDQLKLADSFLVDLIFCFFAFSGFPLYFIVINCPISLLFNRKMIKSYDQPCLHPRHQRLFY